MFSTILIGNDSGTCACIQSTIEQYCRDVTFKGMASDWSSIPLRESDRPDLVFWDSLPALSARAIDEDPFPGGTINVLLLDNPLSSPTIGLRADWSAIQTFLYKPLQVPELLIALNHGRSLLELRKAFHTQQDTLQRILERQSQTGIVGIPTEDGMEFMPAQDILRCEGLNKYTLIVTANHGQMVSSYNIGEFAKLLQMNGFFAPHKSHLVNLRCIKRLTSENQIVLKDGSQVPLSRRRRLEFVQLFRGEQFH